ncbi:trypsin-like [Trichogramma pretiosum]|uniref:trypsin-like n=1 Tax=Trichogramma pretiosum TaxID=7493 RepID=UPI000C71C426|nr:trypsin-like [Trichogramma pretiosum]
MKYYICLSLLLVGVNSFYIDDEPSNKDKILGGKIASIKKFPYQAQFVAWGLTQCGASIVSDLWLITACHCIVGTWFMLPRQIITGTRFNGRGGVLREIDYIVQHPRFVRANFDNDIAMIKLKEPIVFDSKQRPIPLINRRVKVGDRVLISGFGIEKEDPSEDVSMRVGSPKLLKASVYATDYESCREIYARTNDSRAVSDNMFCAWAPGKDSCHGDSGGPAVVGGKLAGIVSFGDVCGSADFPGVYTQLHNYLAWIAEVMGEQRSGLELYVNQPNVQKDPDVENVDGEEEGEYVDVDDYYDDNSFWHKAVDFTKSKVNAIAEKFGFVGPIWKRYL